MLLFAIVNAGIIYGVKALKKITIVLPEELVEKAQESTGEGITETIRQGLKLVAASEAYMGLKKLRGTYKSSVDIKKLRDDRR